MAASLWLRLQALLCLALLCTSAQALRYDEAWTDYNLNQNQTATEVLDYWGEWENHTYWPSPENWRVPFYTVFLDRLANGDPTNDDANGTAWEHDVAGTQLRAGGDVQGFINTLDYIAGLGIKAVYLSGVPMINLPWEYDMYSPTDLSLLDAHLGDIAVWRKGIEAAHERGIYVLMDNTMGTMSDLIGFEGYLNESTPYTPKEHNALWKGSRRYHDFSFNNTEYEICDVAYPRFWGDDGFQVNDSNTAAQIGCRAGDFDQYGDVSSFGLYPQWQRQISKFASVQDRLREWRPSVRERIQHFSCMELNMLDFDGYRMDKGTQITPDAMGEWADYMRSCAKALGKDNFLIVGEVVNGDAFGSIYYGRGREPQNYNYNQTEMMMITNETQDDYVYVRDVGKNAFDGAVFHYSFYRAMTRFLGIDGNLQDSYDLPVNWVDAWNGAMAANDFINANTGQFDPRHMYGTANQDVFRWPGLVNGTHKQMLGLFITTLHLPGIPILLWGEEQAFYTLDSTAADYLYGRQPMVSGQAWQAHGCYKLGTVKYENFPLESSNTSCSDNSTSLDHRDPSNPIRNMVKAMYEVRENYPVLNDAFYLQQLSNKTYDIYLPASGTTPTETGMWSVQRMLYTPQLTRAKNISIENSTAWLVYSNENKTMNYTFDCSSTTGEALLSPFLPNTTVKNVFYPFDEYTLESSQMSLGFNDSDTVEYNGCLPWMNFTYWGYKAFVPKDQFVQPRPVVTKITPSHDQRILSNVSSSEAQSLDFELRFSAEMDCDSVTNSLILNSTTESGVTATLNTTSRTCQTVDPTDIPDFSGGIPTVWIYKATLSNVYHGIHQITVANATSQANQTTNSIDHFMFRIGELVNPMVFPKDANYTRGILFQDSTDDSLVVSHKAAGADLFRYSTNWGSSWSDWASYTGGNTSLVKQNWTGTDKQKWDGEHVILQYWSQIASSSDHIVHADLDSDSPARRYPHFFAQGQYNLYGYDAGLANKFSHVGEGQWTFNFMYEWPTQLRLNVWGMNADGYPDVTGAFGDVDGDNILERISPTSLESNMINVTAGPSSPHLAWKVKFNDGDLRYSLEPIGNRWLQLTMWILLAMIPPLIGLFAVWLYRKAYYQVKFNQHGTVVKQNAFIAPIMKMSNNASTIFSSTTLGAGVEPSKLRNKLAKLADPTRANRQTVLVATMEYDIEDWAIKIKIGGLGVMAQLMGKNLPHKDLIWVVPCVGGVDYPVDTPGEPMIATINGAEYEIQVQYHQFANITYVLLDAPIFRQQTKAVPYPPNMDDMESAIYYSAWNQCIAEALRRFPIDIYHINDYHGALAPLYLLPGTIPCCISLHNAEFQGLWAMRSPAEFKEVCDVYNLPPEVVKQFVQFGEVFNLLHAGASYLRVYQKGFGAVGVSKKYGKRSLARYPIFWGLKSIGSLPNPDPTDLGEWDKSQPNTDVVVDPEFEANRAGLKRQAQEWAGLEQRADAELFVFVGRWSLQKGIDLIADVFPAILEENEKVQLICIGPLIDLYGKFAALKLNKLMQLYPGRVYSKPEFTMLPPYIFSGADFALIPSRDEPFGLVAVEFGRKGALGVGSRVGGLGSMPGWWFTVEAVTPKHLIRQFKVAIREALASSEETRAVLRARSAIQRFPVAQWVEDLDILHDTSIKIHMNRSAKSGARTPKTPHTPNGDSPPGTPFWSQGGRSGFSTPRFITGASTPGSPAISRPQSIRHGNVPEQPEEPVPNLPATLSKRLRSIQSRDRASKMQFASIGGVSENIPDESTLTAEQIETNDPSFQAAISRNADGQASQNPLSVKTQPFYRSASSRSLASMPNRLDEVISPISQATSGNSTPTNASRVTLASPSSLAPPRPGMVRKASTLSVNAVVGEKKDYNLQNTDPTFTDSEGAYYKEFEAKLENLNTKNSETTLCISEYLVQSEKSWYSILHRVRLGKSVTGKKNPEVRMREIESSPVQDSGSSGNETFTSETLRPSTRATIEDGYKQYFPEDYQAPTGLRKILHTKVGDWPIYAFLLAFGQIIAANSYQITLLTSSTGETASKLYAIATVYLLASVFWWIIFRYFKSLYVLTLPWLIYGLAFFLLGMAPYESSSVGRGWIQNVASGLYSAASASGAFFFSLNFGSEGSAPVASWSFRACVIQGTQQIYVSLLWYWGVVLIDYQSQGVSTSSLVTYGKPLTAIAVPIACLMWIVGLVLYFGLPNYYRQTPGELPSFYVASSRRKVTRWFFVFVCVQNFFLASPYGRNWEYLWSSSHAPKWAIVLLMLLFFVVIWGVMLFVMGRLSTSHSWILPIFAIGLGAPRWCQMLWGVSGIGQYVPWAGSDVGSAIAGRSLWLWLGLLDTVQGVGYGMMLLQTLTRVHITWALVVMQVLGSAATMVARACAPDNVGPGSVFPNLAFDIADGLSNAWFWIALVTQLMIPVGFFMFFRKEQLSKP